MYLSLSNFYKKIFRLSCLGQYIVGTSFIYLLLLWHALKMKLVTFMLMLCILFHTLFAYKFLGVLPIASKSHYYIGHNLLKGLAEEGHDVTVISPFKEKTSIPNYKEVFLEHSWIESRRGKARVVDKFHSIYKLLNTSCIHFRRFGKR